MQTFVIVPSGIDLPVLFFESIKNRFEKYKDQTHIYSSKEPTCTMLAKKISRVLHINPKDNERNEAQSGEQVQIIITTKEIALLIIKLLRLNTKINDLRMDELICIRDTDEKKINTFHA